MDDQHDVKPKNVTIHLSHIKVRFEGRAVILAQAKIRGGVVRSACASFDHCRMDAGGAIPSQRFQVDHDLCMIALGREKVIWTGRQRCCCNYRKHEARQDNLCSQAP